MRIVSEYRQHAEECRKLAKLAANPDDRKVFDRMAQHWDMLADLRIGDVESGDQSTSVPARTKRFHSVI
jgi:hypothetical protein